MSRASGRRRVGWSIGILLVVSFTSWALIHGWRRIAAYNWNLSAAWLAFGVLLVLTAFAGTGLGYHSLVCRLQPTAAPSSLATVSVWARSMLGRYVPGSVLMVVGRLELGLRLGIARRTSLAASLYEQIFGFALAGVGGVIFLASGAGRADGAWAALLAPLLLAVLHPRIFGPASSWGLAKLKREPLDALLSERAVTGFIGWYAGTTLLMSAGVWALVHSAAPTSGSILVVGGAYQLSVVLGTLAIVVPAGIGVREVALAVALTSRLGADVAAVVAIALRVVLTALEVLFVGVVALVVARR